MSHVHLNGQLTFASEGEIRYFLRPGSIFRKPLFGSPSWWKGETGCAGASGLSAVAVEPGQTPESLVATPQICNCTSSNSESILGRAAAAHWSTGSPRTRETSHGRDRLTVRRNCTESLHVEFLRKSLVNWAYPNLGRICGQWTATGALADLLTLESAYCRAQVQCSRTNRFEICQCHSLSHRLLGMAFFHDHACLGS